MRYFFMEMTFHTKRLILKVLNPTHASMVLEFYKKNQLFFEKWEPDRVHNFYTEKFQYATLTYEYNEMIRSHYLRYFIFTKQSPYEIIGTISFHSFIRGAMQCCTMGYKISESHCNQGYATEAIYGCLPIIFKDYGLHRIEAFVHPKNYISQHLLEKIGFYNEGISYSCVFLNGCWQNHYRYALVDA